MQSSRRKQQTTNTLFDDLKSRVVNTRSSEFLFELFLKKYSILKFSWKENWDEWSKKIFTFFGELGKDRCYEIFLNPKYGIKDLHANETSEYLVDLCWEKQGETSLELALESELSSANDIESIMWDFNKLMDVKAFIKVGICSPLLRDRSTLMEEISRNLARHLISVPTERYLFILIIDHGKKELETQRIEIEGWAVNYLGELKKLGSKYFPE